MTHSVSVVACATLCSAAALLPSCGRGGPDNVDWGYYLGDAASSQASPLTQIRRDNVSRLAPAWVYHTGDASPDGRSQIQCNPLIVDGVLYGTTPRLALFALDAATGQELWRFDPFAGSFDDFGMSVNRGLVFWQDGGDRRILFSAGPTLYAIDAGSGRSIESFGGAGEVDLHVGLGDDSASLFVTANTPGVVYDDLLILGTRVSEGPIAAPGHVRAFDVRTGELRWVFHTIPHPGETGHETWPAGAWEKVGGANAWSGLSVDLARGLVFVPTGSASYDFYGGNREGANLFANSLIALDARTGERVWHYQMVHHDLWDRDLPAPPNLVTLERDGKTIDAVAQITKSGFVFVLDRETGGPLFPVEERAYPASDLAGEVASPTQPLPLAPPPFARQVLTEDELTRRTPEARSHVLERFRRVRSGGQFIPPSSEGTVIFPGFDGGGEWGGAAWDAEDATLYVNSSEMAWILTMVDIGSERFPSGKQSYASYCLYCHGVDRQGDRLGEYPSLRGVAERMTKREVAGLIRAGKGRMPGFAFLSEEDLRILIAYLFAEPERAGDSEPVRRAPPLRFTHTGYERFVDHEGYPAVRPPWGTLTAIDLNRGEIRWQVPLGELAELSAQGIPPTGTENYGGPVVTAGGLVFIAATKDEKIRAFDKSTGEELWEAMLPAGGYATPATYAVAGRQYVVVAAGGGKMGTPSGDAYVAFALPE
jgi:quinoprotein glucose dehydrogenase